MAQAQGSRRVWGGVLAEGHIKEERTSTQFHSYKTRKKYVIQKLGNQGVRLSQDRACSRDLLFNHPKLIYQVLLDQRTSPENQMFSRPTGVKPKGNDLYLF